MSLSMIFFVIAKEFERKLQQMYVFTHSGLSLKMSKKTYLHFQKGVRKLYTFAV